ncbi:hypothetical protein [Nonomuraea sp. B5E05]|uniref:hypothetical protein n=1 Tax=Nonomuraea sp. B5E05 TaxID=3153569 RepID=UPI003261720D
MLAGAMRTAADLLQAARLPGTGGLSITCDECSISIQVSRHGAPDLLVRLAMLDALAAVLGSTIVRDDDPARPAAWLKIHAVAAGIPVRVHAELRISIHGQGEALAMGPDGGTRTHDPRRYRRPLPPGWRWQTELDHTPHDREHDREHGHGPQREVRSS